MSFLKAGKTAFLFLKKKEEFFLATGKQDYISKRTINLVEPHNNYEFIPANIGSITTAEGKHIIFIHNDTFTSFFKSLKSRLVYQVYLENITNAQILFAGKDKNKILGAICKVGAGHL
ncbi:MAG: hypothetical protein HQK89_04145 [Nitrospirae bacterium]|nr:hypothetical protein [Nitrospirota bacterium]